MTEKDNVMTRIYDPTKLSILGDVAQIRRDLMAGDYMTMWDLAFLANMKVIDVERSLIAEGLLSEDDLLSVDDLPEEADTIWGGDIEDPAACTYLEQVDSGRGQEDGRRYEDSLTERGKALIGVRLWALDAASTRAWLGRRGVPLTMGLRNIGLPLSPEDRKLPRTGSSKTASKRTRLVFGHSIEKLAEVACVNKAWLRRFLAGQKVPCAILNLYALAECFGYEFEDFLGLAAEAILSTPPDKKRKGQPAP